MGDPVKHDHADDDRGGGTLRPGILYLPAYEDVSNATGAEAGDLVYATGNGTSTEGVYRYDGSSYSRISGSNTLTDSGSDTDGGDNYQLPQAADNLDLQNDGEIQNAESVEADDLTTNNQPSLTGGLDAFGDVSLIDSGSSAVSANSNTNVVNNHSMTAESNVIMGVIHADLGESNTDNTLRNWVVGATGGLNNDLGYSISADPGGTVDIKLVNNTGSGFTIYYAFWEITP